jgi:hypothetical protein
MSTTSLCFRCEHRASFLEAMREEYQPRPRYECGDIESSKWCCYMYKPVQPATLKVRDGDERPAFAGAMISARMECLDEKNKEMGIDMETTEDENGTVLFTPYWTPIHLIKDT